MNKVLVKPIIISTAGIAALWMIVVLVLGFGTEVIFGDSAAERLTPFANSHLLEEAGEGSYSPLNDPLFIAYTMGTAIAVFGIPTFYLASRRYLSRRVAVVPAMVVVLIIAVLWRYVWAEGYPQPMRLGVLFELVSWCGASILAAAAATRWGRNG